MKSPALHRQPNGIYATGDGRWKITPDHDREAVTRGRGPRIWWITDTTGRTGFPFTVRTLREVRQHIHQHTP